MYTALLNSLNSQSASSDFDKHLQSLKDRQSQHESEIIETRKSYEKQVTELKQKINLLEISEKDLKESLKTEKSKHKLESRQKDADFTELEFTLKQSITEKDKIIFDLKEALEKFEDQKQSDLETSKSMNDMAILKQQKEYEAKLNDIRYLYEQEQATLKNRIRKLEDELAIYKDNESQFELSSEFSMDDPSERRLSIRLSEMNDRMSENMLQTEKQLILFAKEKDDALSEIRTLKTVIEQMKTDLFKKDIDFDVKYNKLQQKYEEKCIEADQAQVSTKENAKLSKKISKLKLSVSELEAAKRELKQQLKQRENELETERIAKKRAVINEKRKIKEKGDKIMAMKKEIDQKTIEIESLKRDNVNMSAQKSDSKIFSPRTRKQLDDSSQYYRTSEKSTKNARRRMESPVSFNLTQNFTENDSQNISTKVSSRRNKKLKSSSPNRT